MGSTRQGGIQMCGNSQNCVAVCPKHIPLTRSIARNVATGCLVATGFQPAERPSPAQSWPQVFNLW